MQRSLCLVLTAMGLILDGSAIPSAAQAPASDAKKTAAAEAQGPTDEKKPELPSVAEGILRVTCEPDSALANRDLVMQLLYSRESTQAAMAVILREIRAWPTERLPTVLVNPDQSDERIKGSHAAKSEFIALHLDLTGDRFTNMPPGVFMSYVGVSSHDERLPADRLLRELANQLQDRLDRLDASRLEADRGHLDQLHTEAAEAADKLRARGQQLQALKRTLGHQSEEVVRQRLLQLDSQLIVTDLELNRLEARQSALEKRVAALAEQVADEAAKDPVVTELEKVVETREKLLDRERVRDKGILSADQFQTMELKIAEARAELAKYQRAAAQASGGERLAELKRRLEDTETEFSEQSSRRRQLESQLEAVPKITYDVEFNELELQIAEEQHRDTVEQSNRLREKLRTHRPVRVTIIPTS